MEKFSRNKLNIVLWVAAAIIAALLAWYAITATHFVVVTWQEAHDKNLIKASEIVIFNLTKAEQLKKR